MALAGRCEEALPLLAAEHQAEPSNSRARLLHAQCAIATRQPAEAERLLGSLSREAPTLRGVWLYLGIARFHVGDVSGASEALARANQIDPDRAQLLLYRGLLELQARRPAPAAELFAQARVQDPEAVEPMASFYEALAFRASGDREAMQAALQRVRTAGEENPWVRAARGLDAQRAAARVAARQWLRMTAGFEYDDNVMLRADDLPLFASIGETRDVRAMWRIQGGSELVSGENWRAGLMLGYTGTRHRDLDVFDIDFPTAALWVERRIAESDALRVVLDGGHAWVDGDSFLTTASLTPMLFHGWGRAGATQLFTRVYRYDYHLPRVDVPGGPGTPLARCLSARDLVCGPPFVDESRTRDRDGYGIAAGFEHRVPLWDGGPELRAGYTYHHYLASGREQTFQGHEVRVGGRANLPLGLTLDAALAYVYRPFRHSASVPDPRTVFVNREYFVEPDARSDQVYRAEVSLSRSITDRVGVSVRYSYLDQDSNVLVYDYDRQVIGAYVHVGIGR